MYEVLWEILHGRKFKKITAKTFDSVKKRYGLRQIEAEILLYLHSSPNASAAEINRSSDLNKGQVSIALSSLREKGFIESYQDPNDRRCVGYTVTGKGSAFIQEADGLRNELFRKLTDGITEEEMEVLGKAMEKMCKNYEKWL